MTKRLAPRLLLPCDTCRHMEGENCDITKDNKMLALKFCMSSGWYDSGRIGLVHQATRPTDQPGISTTIVDDDEGWTEDTGGHG